MKLKSNTLVLGGRKGRILLRPWSWGIYLIFSLKKDMILLNFGYYRSFILLLQYWNEVSSFFFWRRMAERLTILAMIEIFCWKVGGFAFKHYRSWKSERFNAYCRQQTPYLRPQLKWFLSSAWIQFTLIAA